MKREFMVYTSVGDYRVWAYDRADAERLVKHLTWGRAVVDAVRPM